MSNFVPVTKIDGKFYIAIEDVNLVPSPKTVAISLEDARIIAKRLDIAQQLIDYAGYEDHARINLKQAISKAESKAEEESKRQGTILDNRTPIQKIQDQVNELRKEVDNLNHSMRNVIRTQNNGVIQKLNQHTEQINTLENKMEEICPTLS